MIRLCFAVILLFSINSYSESTILCVGDSITEGGSSFNVYRFPLNKLLKEAGYKYKFIGSKSSSDGGPTLKHNGYGGKDTQFLRNNISKIYSENPADFVLLHSGHNSFAKNKPVPKIIKNTKEIIEEIQKINPGAVILIAQVIPSGKLPKYSYIPELNRELKKLSNGPNVHTVDVSKDFDWRTDTVSDKVHPNKQGAKKMASAWFGALKTFSERFK